MSKLIDENGYPLVDHIGRLADLQATMDGLCAHLGVRSVALMTNNPRKVQGLEEGGIEVIRREPHEVEAHEHNREDLRTKQDRLGHLGNNGD